MVETPVAQPLSRGFLLVYIPDPDFLSTKQGIRKKMATNSEECTHDPGFKIHGLGWFDCL